MAISNIGIGTVQFGLDYGINNENGIVPKAEVDNILDFALRKNMIYLDTAQDYGNSESVLGSSNKGLMNHYVVTKTQQTSRNEIILAFDNSLKCLKLESVYALMIHNAASLLEQSTGKEVHDTLVELKKIGKIKKLGVSVYNPEDLKHITDSWDIDIVQIPLNVIDQRFLKNSFLQELQAENIEIHARSVLLQGLLLMDINDIDPYFSPIKDKLMQLDQLCAQADASRIEMLLQFVLKNPCITVGILGVQSLAELKKLHCAASVDLDIPDMSSLSMSDPAYVNPALWPHA